jgi:V-type H+-transporting ATPase subunit A
MPDTIYKLSTQKFQLPTDGEAANVAHFQALNEEIATAFRSLED